MYPNKFADFPTFHRAPLWGCVFEWNVWTSAGWTHLNELLLWYGDMHSHFKLCWAMRAFQVISLLCVVLMYECFLQRFTLDRLLSAIINVSMRAVMSAQQILGSKLKTVVINSAAKRKCSGNRIKLLYSEISFWDSSDGAQDLSGGRCFIPNSFTVWTRTVCVCDLLDV